MSAPALGDWVFFLTGAALGMGGLALALWALFWDRARGRRRCPKCWYALDGVPPIADASGERWVCPECGKGFRSARRLLKTRRKPAWALAGAIVLCAAYATFKAPKWRRGSWTALVPTSVLVLVAPATDPTVGVSGYSRIRTLTLPAQMPSRPVAPSMTERMESETWSRLLKGRMWRWQSQLFIERYVDHGNVTLLDSVLFPARWVDGEPIPVRTGIGAGWQQFLGTGWRVTLPATKNGERPQGSVFMAPVRADGSVRLRLDVRSDQKVIYSHEYTLPVVMVKDKADIFTLLDSEEASRRVREALNVRLVEREGQTVIFVNQRGNTLGWGPIYFGLAFHVKVVIDEEVVGHAAGSAAWDHFVIKPWTGLDRVEWAPDGLQRVLQSPRRARFVVSGDLDAAWKLYSAWPFDKPKPSVWAGTYEVPVRVERRSPGRDGS